MLYNLNFLWGEIFSFSYHESEKEFKYYFTISFYIILLTHEKLGIPSVPFFWITIMIFCLCMSVCSVKTAQVLSHSSGSWLFLLNVSSWLEWILENLEKEIFLHSRVCHNIVRYDCVTDAKFLAHLFPDLNLSATKLPLVNKMRGQFFF